MDNKVVVIDDISIKNEFTVKDNENVTFVIFLVSEKDQEGSVLVRINGANANVRILGLVIGDVNQKIKLYTLQEHLKEKSVSDLLIKSVLFGSSRLNYEGLIKIAKDAQKSNAYQKNQNLLMGSRAWADSRPKLEILANDVRCTHGATIGKIDQDVLYYLKTRGISDKKAEALVIGGFFQDVLNRIPDDKVRDNLQKIIAQKIKSSTLN